MLFDIHDAVRMFGSAKRRLPMPRIFERRMTRGAKMAMFAMALPVAFAQGFLLGRQFGRHW